MKNHEAYADTHWSRIDNPEMAIKKYIEMYEDTYNSTKFNELLDFIGDVKNRKILDYGGGIGYMSIELAKRGAEVTLVDAASKAIETSKVYAKNNGVILNSICAEYVPSELQNGQFDIVILKDVIEHVYEDQQLVNNLSKCIKVNGKLIITTQNSESYNYKIEGNIYKIFKPNRKWMGWDRTHLRFYTPDILCNMMKINGFDDFQFRSVYIAPYKLLSLITKGKIKREPAFLLNLESKLIKNAKYEKKGWNIMVKGIKEE